MNLNKKRIIITGGTSGVGYELVKQLAANNRVIVIARNPTLLNQLFQTFANVTTYQADLSRLDEVEKVAKRLVEKGQPIDVLINNAAVQNTPTFLDKDFEYASIAPEITLNFTSICCLSSLLLPVLQHDDKAVILNVNSGLGLAPKRASAVYCATKGALNIFSQSLRYQLENTNISVQQAFLGLVDTAMTHGRGQNKMTPHDAAAAIIDGIQREIPDHDIGKVPWLRLLLRLAPATARKILKKY